ncbi:hypothetical protein M1D46_08765 [Microbacterium sp. JZ70]
MIRLLMSFIFGAGVAALLFSIFVGDRFTWIWITAIIVLSTLFPLVLVARSMGSLAGLHPKKIEAARAAGRFAPARIDALRRTGTTINDQPVCEIDVSVAPADRPAYRTTIRQLVDIVRIPQYQPGASVTVARLEADAPEVAIIEDEVPDAARLSRLPAREHVAEWQDGPVVLGAERAPRRRKGDPIIGTGPKGRGWRIAAYVVLALAGAAAVLVPVADDVRAETLTIITGEDHASMFAEGRVQRALAAIEEAAGTDETVQVLVYEEFVSADMATAPGSDRFDTFFYRGGTVENQGPASIQPENPDAERFRFDDIAWAAFPELLAQALGEAGLTRDELVDGPYMFVERGYEEGAPVGISISFGDGYADYAFIGSADGAFLGAR